MSGLWNGRPLPTPNYPGADYVTKQTEMRLLITLSAQILSELERAAIHGSMEDLRQTAIARTHGVSATAVDKARERGLLKMREQLRTFRIVRLSDIL